MNQTKFTSGPWTHTPLQQKIWANDGDLHVATVADLPWINNKSDWLTEEANARLISKAPEMFEALKALLEADNAICENIGAKSDQAMQRIAAIDQAQALLNSIQNGGEKSKMIDARFLPKLRND